VWNRGEVVTPTERIEVKEELCTGCKICTLICSAVKEGVFMPSRSRCQVLIDTQAGLSKPMICRHCEDAPCVEACPVGAIEIICRGAEFYVSAIDQETCVQCKLCKEACSYDAIFEFGELLYKCDLCGGKPACIDQCYPGALILSNHHLGL
jgi:anaerobic carbon-monoxide dehydrogenase iron sulfur subunit